MSCAVCKRQNQKYLLNFFDSKICGACKVSFYRSLRRLHKYLEENIVLENSIQQTEYSKYEQKKSQLVDKSVLKLAIWEYLSNREFCKKKSSFLPGTMCKIICCDNENLPCTHCRFRKTILAIEQLSLISKGCLKNSMRILKFEILQCLKRHSKEILGYCRSELVNSLSMRVRKLEISEYSGSKKNVPEITSENPGSPLFKNRADSKILGSQKEILMDFIRFYESPLGRANSQLSDIAAKDWMQLHLHYRSVKVTQDNNEPGLADWMCDHACALVTYPRAQTPFTQVSQLLAAGTRIFWTTRV